VASRPFDGANRRENRALRRLVRILLSCLRFAYNTTPRSGKRWGWEMFASLRGAGSPLFEIGPDALRLTTHLCAAARTEPLPYAAG
jgi:hypothetical protein